MFPTYTLSPGRKDFQLLSYVEDAETLLLHSPVPKVWADINYTVLFPKLIWSPLWTLLDSSTQEPIQERENIITDGEYDILTGTWELRVYFNDTEFFDTSWGDILDIIPNRDCKRIFDLWKSKWSGEYVIMPNWVTNVRVYCEMDIDGGWWTLLARSVSWWATAWFGWTFQTWDIKDDSQPYSYWEDSRFIDFSQIMLAPYSSWKNILFATSYDVNNDYYKTNYNLQSLTPDSPSYTDSLTNCNYLIEHPTDTTPTHCSTYNKRYWWKFWYEGYVIARNTSEEYGLRGDGTDFYWNDEYSSDQAMLFVR